MYATVVTTAGNFVFALLKHCANKTVTVAICYLSCKYDKLQYSINKNCFSISLFFSVAKQYYDKVITATAQYHTETETKRKMTIYLLSRQKPLFQQTTWLLQLRNYSSHADSRNAVLVKYLREAITTTAFFKLL